MAKVFISHSWNDNEISRKIAHELRKDGAKIWIDYARIKAGDTLPERISNALEWCDTLVLVWSKAAAASYWVKKEWQSALTLQKEIIPFIIDDTPLPAILCSFVYINFKNFSQGYEELLRALDLEQVKPLAAQSKPPKKARPKIKIPTQKILKFAAIFIVILILGFTATYIVQKIAAAREAKRVYWEKRQIEMNNSFQQAQQSDDDTQKSASDKGHIWQQFLTEFAADNPFVQQDDTQRQEAVKQRNRWNNQAKQDAEKAQWAQFQEEMDRSYQQALQRDNLSSLSAADKATIWQNFLNQYANKDNPYSQEDNEKRASAMRKKDSWLDQAEQESEKVRREQRQAAMTKSYNEAKQRDQNTNLSPDAKVQTWQKFLTDYAEDISFSQQDNDQRNYANGRVTFWSKFIDQKPATKTVKGMTLVFIPGGTFDMGDTFGDGEADEKPVHSVIITDFYIGMTEVTVAQYRNFCQTTGRQMPSMPKWGWHDSHPIVNVIWNDANEFCKWARYRLPSEAEWEYAAREGGKKIKWSGTSNHEVLGEYAWYSRNSERKTHPVSTRKPNNLGLYDMSGNAWEWCADWYDNNYYQNSPRKNPKGPTSGAYRLLRGGSWLNDEWVCRALGRYYGGPDVGYEGRGFRVVQDSPL